MMIEWWWVLVVIFACILYVKITAFLKDDTQQFGCAFGLIVLVLIWDSIFGERK